MQVADEGISPQSRGFLIKGSLAKLLMAWFLVISLAPLLISSALGYLRFKNKIEQDLSTQMKTSIYEIENYVQEIFEETIRDCQTLADLTFLTDFMQDLNEGFADNGVSAEEYVRSYDWEKRVRFPGRELRNFQNNLGHIDILLANLDGEILFSVAREAELGMNLIKGELAETRLSEAFKRTVLTGKSSISSFEEFGISESIASTFCTTLLVDSNGNPVGVACTQDALDRIDPIGRNQLVANSEMEVYLVSRDMILQTNSIRLGESTTEIQKLDTAFGQDVRTALADSHYKETGNSNYHICTSYRGEEVFSLHRSLSVGGLLLGLTVEKPTSLAMAPLQDWLKNTLLVFGVTVVIVMLLVLLLANLITQPLRRAATLAGNISKADYSQELDESHQGEIGDLAKSMNSMIRELRQRSVDDQRNKWIMERLSRLKDVLMKGEDLNQVLDDSLKLLCLETEAICGCIYRMDEAGKNLILASTFSCDQSTEAPSIIALGDGLPGQVAQNREKRILSLPESKGRLRTTANSEISIGQVICIPVLLEKNLLGVIEIDYIEEIDTKSMQLLEEFMETLAISMIAHLSNQRTRELLDETQQLAAELEEQKEELNSSYQEVSETTEELRQQQAELWSANKELQHSSDELEAQRQSLEERNRELKNAQDELELQSHKLSESNKYKSQFLANMSHELRTPLNAILLLSRNLASNAKGHLSDEDVNAAEIIAKSGQDLLDLFNTILDQSRIESHQIRLNIQPVDFVALQDHLVDMFSGLAEEKNLDYRVELMPGLPDGFLSDSQRLLQIARNLVTNAIKFTEEGKVVVTIAPAMADSGFSTKGICISVADTGIGIEVDKQDLIFDAFRQVDGSFAREQMGTGLGLTISRNLAEMLNGKIELDSKPGVGSEFRLVLDSMKEAGEFDMRDSAKPAEGESVRGPVKEHDPNDAVTKSSIQKEITDVAADADDRDTIREGDKVILIVEEKGKLLEFLRSEKDTEPGKLLGTDNMREALEFCQVYPVHSIFLEVGMPELAAEEFLKRKERDPVARKISIVLVSNHKVDWLKRYPCVAGVIRNPPDSAEVVSVLQKIDYISNRKRRTVVLAVSDCDQCKSIQEIIGNGNVVYHECKSAASAISIMENESVDIVIADLDLEDCSASDFLELCEKRLEDVPPVILYVDKLPDPEMNMKLELLSNSIILKSVRSKERLIDETAYLLHRNLKDFPKKSRRAIDLLRKKDNALQDKRVLLVDDDMRNLYSLGKHLRDQGVLVTPVDNGQSAMEAYSDQAFDFVLMDIMMPGMDGLEVIGNIRKLEKEAGSPPVPIIVLSAKAMQGDRLKCIEAGANDYLVKPVDSDELLEAIRRLLY